MSSTKIKTLKNEKFRDIKGFPGYQVSNRGRVFSTANEKVMAPYKGKTVVLTKGKKPFCRAIGRLVAETFIGPVKKGQHVRTSKPGNFSVENLVIGASA